MGQALLIRTGHAADGDSDRHGLLQYTTKLSSSDISKYQTKLARSIIMFMELLHLLIARNRDLLLEVVQARKRSSRAGGYSVGSTSSQRVFRQASTSHAPSPSNADSVGRYNTSTSANRSMYSVSKQVEHRTSMNTGYDAGSQRYRGDEESGQLPGGGASVTSAAPGDRTDSAIAVQSELQRAFISMSKVLYPLLYSTVHSETPRWLKLCGKDSYFSSGTYRQTRIAMGEDLFFFGAVQPTARAPPDDYHENKPGPIYGVPVSIVPSRSGGVSPAGSYAGSVTSRASRASRQSRQSRNSVGSENRNRHAPSPSHSSSGTGTPINTAVTTPGLPSGLHEA